MLEIGSIELSPSNLYTHQGRILDFGDGQMVLIREPLEWVHQEGDDFHLVLDSDRLELLAYKYYQGRTTHPERHWWVIADANILENPLDLSGLVGQYLLIPNILNVRLKLRK